MKAVHSLLVGAALDGRDGSTLAHAAWFARATGAMTVYVAHVFPSFDPPEGIGDNDLEAFRPIDEELEASLKAILGRHTALFASGTIFHPVVRQGALTPELLRLATQKSADLLVLGRATPNGNDPLSENALQLVRKSPCSVLVVPPGREPSYARILVPVDFSDYSREALEMACRLARSDSNSTVIVQHTYEVPLGWHKSGRTYEEFADTMKQNAVRRWEKFAATVQLAGVRPEIRFDLGDDVPGVVLRVAEEIDASLLVMGSHGRTRPAEFLLGHVADKVCARTVRPVLCVKRKGEVVNLLHALLQVFDFEDR